MTVLQIVGGVVVGLCVAVLIMIVRSDRTSDEGTLGDDVCSQQKPK